MNLLTTTQNDLTKYRAQFDSVRDCHYLISNSLGAMPNRARERTRQYLDLWAARGVRAWEDQWWMLAQEVGDKIGALMNAPPGTVSMHANVTSASATVLSSFDFDGARNKIVMVDMEFPSIQYLYHEWVRGRGRIQTIACPDGVTVPLDQMLSAIDETTLLVPISHVLFRSSFIVDARAVIEKAHRVGARVVLDVFQSLGSVPVDVQALDTDFTVGGCLKWLCGGPGACFLYVRPDLMETLSPRFTGWFAHENPFAFAPGPIRRTRGAYRFMNGTPVVPALYTCQAGLEIVTEIGVEAIRERSANLTSRLVGLAADRGWRVTAPAGARLRGGTVAIDLPGADRIAAELNARDYLVDYRPSAGIRISPHFYNTDDEIDDVVAEIESIVREGVHP